MRWRAWLNDAFAEAREGVLSPLELPARNPHRRAPSCSDALPFAVIIVVMALRSRTVLARGGDVAERNPSIGRPHTPLRTADGYYDKNLGQFILPYEAVRHARDPDALLLGFLQDTYEAAADLAQWDRKALERS